MVLGLICYCDKTGTDVYQQNSLEPFSFTFCIFNQECRYKTVAWQTLGQLPDFDNISSASHCASHVGYKGKSWSIHNFHTCLENIMEPFLATKEIINQFTPTFILVIKLLCVTVFSQWLMLWVMV